LLNVISPSPPAALTSEPMQLLGFPDLVPWAPSAATDKVIRSDGTSLLIRSPSAAVGNSGGAVFDSFKRLVGLVTKIPSGGGEAHALTMKVVLDQLARWKLEVSLRVAATPTGSEELAAFFEKETQINVRLRPIRPPPPAVVKTGVDQGFPSLHISGDVLVYLVSIVFAAGAQELKPQVHLEFGSPKQPRRVSFRPPDYLAEVPAPPIVLQARLLFDLADGRKIGPITKTIDFESEPFASAKKNVDIVRLKNAANSWKRSQDRLESTAKAVEEIQRRSDEALRPRRMSQLLRDLKLTYEGWRILCRSSSAQWNCSTQRFTSQISSYKPLNVYIQDLALFREPDAPEIGIPIDSDSWREAFDDAIAQLLRNGAESIYVKVRLQTGETLGPKQLCTRSSQRGQEHHECK
jgi:hypothetical protein